ncbi:MAG TPA: flavodoxin [Candidatus Caccousia avistercoris]|nr:flavodoxin [Candidatus Caccousia avistercoris]
MKKLLALWLGIAMTLGLTACSGGAASSAAPSAASSEAAPASSAAEEASSAASEQEEPSSAAAEPESGESQAAEETAEGGRTLVVYFSATGNTEEAAGYIASLTGGDLFELEPAQPYTSEDLNYGNEDSRVSREHADESLRDVELVADTVENWEDYDTVFLGYPIWWGIAAWPVDTFVEANDFTGKTVIPFATSASSGLGESGRLLAELAGTGDWQEGMRFRSSVSEADVQSWLEELGLL